MQHIPATTDLRSTAGRGARAFVQLASLLVLTLLLGACSHHGSVHSEVDTGTGAPGAIENVVVLVSLDGFRWDQLQFPEAKNLQSLAARGSAAQGLIPVFPSKTFPNHYSIVTGLYPRNHGILSNNMRDPELGDFRLSDREAVTDSRWWGGEPIWLTAHKAGMRTAAMFWPGTETAIQGVQPDEWFPYDSNKPFAERVQQVLAWLAEPPATRPRVVTLYFEEPDSSNHRHGPLSPQARATIGSVDDQIGRLVAGIEELGMTDRVDLVVVSDHGMADVHSERVIVLDDYAEFEDGELLEFGAFVQIFPEPGREELLFEALHAAHPHLSVYRKHDVLAELRLASAERLAPIIAVPDVGWEAVTRRRADRLPSGSLGGHHGPDPGDVRMHGLFVAAGPSIQTGVELGRFENVHIYEFLCALLDVESAPNDGDNRLAKLLNE